MTLVQNTIIFEERNSRGYCLSNFFVCYFTAHGLYHRAINPPDCFEFHARRHALNGSRAYSKLYAYQSLNGGIFKWDWHCEMYVYGSGRFYYGGGSRAHRIRFCSGMPAVCQGEENCAQGVAGWRVTPGGIYSQRQSFLSFVAGCADFCRVLSQNFLAKIVRIPRGAYSKRQLFLPFAIGRVFCRPR